MDITITSETKDTSETQWRAMTKGRQFIGKTAGEALDNLSKELGERQNGYFIVYEQWQPDDFFTATQQQRLQELMTRWRAARDAGGTLSANEQQELEQLVEAELAGSARRAEKMVSEKTK